MDIADIGDIMNMVRHGGQVGHDRDGRLGGHVDMIETVDLGDTVDMVDMVDMIDKAELGDRVDMPGRMRQGLKK